MNEKIDCVSCDAEATIFFIGKEIMKDHDAALCLDCSKVYQRILQHFSMFELYNLEILDE